MAAWYSVPALKWDKTKLLHHARPHALERASSNEQLNIEIHDIELLKHQKRYMLRVRTTRNSGVPRINGREDSSVPWAFLCDSACENDGFEGLLNATCWLCVHDSCNTVFNV